VNVSLVTNTRDLLIPAKEEAFNNLAYLFGYPNYGVSAEGRKALVKKRARDAAGLLRPGVGGKK